MNEIAAEPISLLMPVYNEADIIEDVIEEWVKKVISKLPEGSELILDDSSNDGTQEILKKLQKKYSFIKLNFSSKDGFFNSALRLYGLARCDLIFFTDSDGQYAPEEFWKIIPFINEYDMVHGAKQDRKDPFYRASFSSVYNRIVRKFFNLKNSKDINSAFRLIRRPVIAEVLDKIHCLRMLPNSEMYIRAAKKDFKIKNVLVQHRKRKFGKSKSLPALAFYKECCYALMGLWALKKELKYD